MFRPAVLSTTTSAPAGSTPAQSTLTRNPAGQQTGISYALPGGHTLADTVARSQAGRIMTDTAALDGASASAWSYTYDSAGRLTQAILAAHGSTAAVTYGYGYANTGGCGADVRAGMDGARSSASVQVGTGTAAVTTSCTDYASRLTSVTGSGAAAYNSHGDATSIGGQTFTYDASDRVTAGTGTGGTQTVTYTLDATGRIVTRVGTGTGTGVDTTTSVYSYTGVGDTPDLQLTAAGTIGERYLPLPGGVLYTKRYTNSGGDIWALPNIHGDTLTTIGTAAPVVAAYDPYGTPLNPATGLADATTNPTTRTGGLTDAWLGSNQRGAEHTAGAAWTLMGARIYLPGLGQFTSVDTVEGGNVNAYVYPCDPVNGFDLTGRFNWKAAFHYSAALLGTVSAVSGLVPGWLCEACSAISLATGLLSAGAHFAAGEGDAGRETLVLTAAGVAFGGAGRLAAAAGKGGRIAEAAATGGGLYNRTIGRFQGILGMLTTAGASRGRLAYYNTAYNLPLVGFSYRVHLAGLGRRRY